MVWLHPWILFFSSYVGYLVLRRIVTDTGKNASTTRHNCNHTHTQLQVVTVGTWGFLLTFGYIRQQIWTGSVAHPQQNHFLQLCLSHIPKFPQASTTCLPAGKQGLKHMILWWTSCFENITHHTFYVLDVVYIVAQSLQQHHEKGSTCTIVHVLLILPQMVHPLKFCDFYFDFKKWLIESCSSLANEHMFSEMIISKKLPCTQDKIWPLMLVEVNRKRYI